MRGVPTRATPSPGCDYSPGGPTPRTPLQLTIPSPCALTSMFIMTSWNRQKAKPREVLLINSHQQQPFILAKPRKVHPSHDPPFLCSHPGHPPHAAHGALWLHVSLLLHLGVLGMRQPWRHGTWHVGSGHSMGLALCPYPLPSEIYEIPFSTVPALQSMLPVVWSKGRRSRKIHRYTPQ